MGLSAPVALAVVGGPLAGAAIADPSVVVQTDFAIERVVGMPTFETRGQITWVTFTEVSRERNDVYPGTTTTTWTCMRRAGAPEFRCKGEAEFIGTYDGVTGPADLRLTATCTEPSRFFYDCEGWYRLDGRAALEGLRGQATWQSSGLFGQSEGTGELRLHDHR